MQPTVDAPLSGFGENQCTQDPRIPMQPIQTPYSAPLVTPMVALVLPNYMFPQMGGAPRQPFYPKMGSFPAQPTFQPQPSFAAQAPFPPQSTFTIQTQFTPQNPFTSQTPFPPQPFPFACPEDPPKPAEPELREEPSRSPTPHSVGGGGPPSPPLFQSRCSSPLQLNLLQLEETQRSAERQESTAPSVVPQTNCNSSVEKAGCATVQAKTDKSVPQVGNLSFFLDLQVSYYNQSYYSAFLTIAPFLNTSHFSFFSFCLKVFKQHTQNRKIQMQNFVLTNRWQYSPF